MSRETRVNRTIRRALERQLKEAESKKPSLSTKVAKVLIFAIGIPGVLAALLALLPRVNVTASDPVDSANPFSASFTVTNTGLIPLWVTISIAPAQIGTRGTDPIQGFKPDYKTRLQRPEWQNVYFGLDDKLTITTASWFGLAPQASLNYAEIAIVVSYKTPVIPLHGEKIFPFVARKQTNGQFYWYSKPFS